MKYLKTNVAAILFLCLCSTLANSKVLLGLVDEMGNPVHTADEFTLHISASVTPDPQGYKYSYNINNDVLSNQSVWGFRFFFQDPYAIVQGTAYTPWEIPTTPKFVGNKYDYSSYFGSDPDGLNPQPLHPNQSLTGVTFVSPYPPGIIQLYAEGYVKGPWVPDGMAPIGGAPAFSQNSPYGPGKIIPVIGPVKPAVGAGGVASPYNNVTVQQCVGASCTVQLSAVGPQDPYGTAYTYAWSGGFGTVPGANPTLQLPAGTNPVTLTVSDPYGTVLTTATMDVVVVAPNPVVIPPAGGGAGNAVNQGGGNGNGGQTGGNAQNGSGDIDHDGIPDDEDDDRDGDGISDDEDDDRDGDGKSNDEDDDPDHAD